MANLGNAWHIPANPEPPGMAGMRDPVFPTTPGTPVTLSTGNQFAGDGNPGNQLQVGSSLFFAPQGSATWTEVPLTFTAQVDNNKYYSAAVPLGNFQAGNAVRYYLQIAYDDHDTTFLQLNTDGVTSATTGDEAAAQANPFLFTIDTPEQRGEWAPVFPLPNVGIHAHVLPNGLVLMWGRRDDPSQSLNVDPPTPLQPGGPPAPPATCTPFLWDPATGAVSKTGQPTMPDGSLANLFCSGHAFLADGRLFVAGGHLSDGAGVNQTTIYDPAASSWTPGPPMNDGRWYPTVTRLPDGSALVLSGSFAGPDGGSVPNTVPQVWRAGAIGSLVSKPEGALDLFPRVHVRSNGQVIVTGSLAETWSLDTSGTGTWTDLGIQRANGLRDYAPSVLFGVDQVLYIGGGSPPIADAELLDLSQQPLAWRDPKDPASQMTFPRRQHNATILPDGSVLVTGGTRSGGAGPPENFNNLDPGQPIHVAELWDPGTGHWTQLAAEKVDRCYHSTAVLLPDGRVLSAGGGEFFPVEGVTQENAPQDSHLDGQIFSPPYLFKGAQPVITAAPAAVSYGETFQVGTAQPGDIQKVTWIGLSSVTHSFNTGQRFIVLAATPSAGGLDVTAPASPDICPPGHYLMFLVSTEGVPSVAKIVQVAATAAAPAAARAETAAPVQAAAEDVFALRASVLAAATGTKVVVGITGTCPYGIAACWGGANEALFHLDGVEYVDPIANAEDSTATVFLAGDGLPSLDRWREDFRRIANDSYTLRGFEVTVSGQTAARDGTVILSSSGGSMPPLVLMPLDQADVVQWDRSARAPRTADPAELGAYIGLARETAGRADTPGAGLPLVTVTGPLVLSAGGYRLQVRTVAEPAQ
jgi:galactose oxidase